MMLFVFERRILIWEARALQGTFLGTPRDAGDIFRCLDLPAVWQDGIVQDRGIDYFNALRLSG